MRLNHARDCLGLASVTRAKPVGPLVADGQREPGRRHRGRRHGPDRIREGTCRDLGSLGWHCIELGSQSLQRALPALRGGVAHEELRMPAAFGQPEQRLHRLDPALAIKAGTHGVEQPLSVGLKLVCAGEAG